MTPRRRLDAEVVRRGLASGRDEAKRLIGAGRVLVNGSSMVKPATLVSPAAAISIASGDERWASRAGAKLAHALGIFALDVAGAQALDVGASTGGFTDVLLSAGATHVTAVDVGYGQMVWRLSQDPRVTVRDRTNFRTVAPAELGAPFDVVVVDASFISVTLLTPNLAAVGRPATDYVVLVKPQFEVGRSAVGRGGIVDDASAHAGAITRVRDALARHGIGPLAVSPSPITGAKGNREFLIHGRHGAPPALPDSVVTEQARR